MKSIVDLFVEMNNEVYVVVGNETANGNESVRGNEHTQSIWKWTGAGNEAKNERWKWTRNEPRRDATQTLQFKTNAKHLLQPKMLPQTKE